MTTRPKAAKTTAQPEFRDWVYLGLVIVLGGSSFAMIRTAVETLPPTAIMVGRLWVAAALLYAMARFKRRRFPPVIARTRDGPRLHRAWAYMASVGIIGNTIPFWLFPWAQQYVESGLAGVYMAFMPIWTLGLAYLFIAERLTRNKIIGFGLGLVGVLLLMGPDALRGVASSSFLAQAAMLTATLCYAGSTIIARRAPRLCPRVFAAGGVIAAAIAATPALLFIDIHASDLTPEAIWAVIGLGIAPSGIGVLFIIILIQRVGATFMALGNYLTPIWALIIGAVLFGESFEPAVFIALGIILAGVFISQRTGVR